MVGAILDRNQTSNSSKEIQMLMVVIFSLTKTPSSPVGHYWSLGSCCCQRRPGDQLAFFWSATFSDCHLALASTLCRVMIINGTMYHHEHHHLENHKYIFCSPSSCVCHLLPPTEGRYWKVLQVILRSYRRLIFFIIIIIQICTVSIINYHQRFICASS